MEPLWKIKLSQYLNSIGIHKFTSEGIEDFVEHHVIPEYLNSTPNVQGSDTTDDAQRTNADNQ